MGREDPALTLMEPRDSLLEATQMLLVPMQEFLERPDKRPQWEAVVQA